MPLERELKFSVLDAYVPSLSELRAALEGTPYQAQAAPLQAIEDRYFDDDAGSLRDAGVALRLRRANGRRLASLKAAGSAEGALHQRDELEIPLGDGGGDGGEHAGGGAGSARGDGTLGARDGAEAGDAPAASDAGSRPAWPEPILGRLPDGVAPADLAPRIELTTTRVRFHLDRDGRRVAELAFDEVTARVPGGERSAHFDEVEIEGLGDASSADLEAIAEVVDGIVRLTANPVNKLERAAALLLLATW